VGSVPLQRTSLMDRSSDLTEKVKAILATSFPPPSEVTVSDDDGLIGIVVSPHFEGMDDIDRQDLAWKELDQHLTREERRRIAIIVTVTPREAAGHLASKFD
jgi:acid stress-induced BolA-like protein IbaG/YrbA